MIPITILSVEVYNDAPSLTEHFILPSSSFAMAHEKLDIGTDYWLLIKLWIKQRVGHLQTSSECLSLLSNAYVGLVHYLDRGGSLLRNAMILFKLHQPRVPV